MINDLSVEERNLPSVDTPYRIFDDGRVRVLGERHIRRSKDTRAEVRLHIDAVRADIFLLEFPPESSEYKDYSPIDSYIYLAYKDYELVTEDGSKDVELHYLDSRYTPGVNYIDAALEQYRYSNIEIRREHRILLECMFLLMHVAVRSHCEVHELNLTIVNKELRAMLETGEYGNVNIDYMMLGVERLLAMDPKDYDAFFKLFMRVDGIVRERDMQRVFVETMGLPANGDKVVLTVVGQGHFRGICRVAEDRSYRTPIPDADLAELQSKLAQIFGDN